MRSSRRPVHKDYSILFLGGILLGIVMVVFGMMLAFTQSRASTPRLRDLGEQSSRLQRSSSFSMNGTTFIFETMERTRSGHIS